MLLIRYRVTVNYYCTTADQGRFSHYRCSHPHLHCGSRGCKQQLLYLWLQLGSLESVTFPQGPGMMLVHVKGANHSGFSSVINHCKTSCLQVAGEDALGLSSSAIQICHMTEFSIRTQQRQFLKELLPIILSIYNDILFYKGEVYCADGKRVSNIISEIGSYWAPVFFSVWKLFQDPPSTIRLPCLL